MIETQTHTPVPYEDLTPKLRKEICNGCGGKGGIVKPPYRIFFRASCNHHDYGYFKGCTASDRREADQALYRAMKKDVATLPWWKQLRYRPWCWLYYAAVRAVGWRFFHYGPAKRYPFLTQKKE